MQAFILSTYRRIQQGFVFLLVGVLVMLGTGVEAQSADTQSADATTQEAGGLFSSAVSRIPVNAPSEAMRLRTVSINLDMMGGEDGPSLEPSGVGQTLALNLFDDVNIVAELDQLNHNLSGSHSWIGHVVDSPMSQASFVVRDGVMIGVVFTNGRVYEIRYVGEGVHMILQVNQSQFIDHAPGWSEALHASQPSAHQVINNLISTADDGKVIDIMVGYTDDARVAAGGTTAIQNTAQLAVDASNTAYRNSNVAQHMYLVHTAEFSYAESGSSFIDLNRWEGKSDGFMDNAHALRNTYHADLMMLLTEDGGGYCGVANRPFTFSVGFENQAFGVTARSCAVGNLSFAHEAGHNMGLRHDWYVDSNTSTLGTAAHGFSNPADSWRTVMAYNSHCQAVGGSCTRIAYFSNPNIFMGGDRMGVAAGTSVACNSGSLSPNPSSCDTDNASILNAGDTIYAQWRTSHIVWTGAANTNWNTAANWNFVQGTTQNGGSTSIVNRVPLAIDDVVIPGGLSNYPTITSGSVVAREMLIQTGGTLNMTGGTLTINGPSWEEQGSGRFNGTGGKVVFDGLLDQTIRTAANSNFFDVQFGVASTLGITLDSDVDLDGDVVFSAGSSLNAGSRTINVGGDWQDFSRGFMQGSSTVVFDGTSAQTVAEAGTTKIYLVGNEAFEGSFPPSGWSLVDNTGNGNWNRSDLFSGTNNVTSGTGNSAASAWSFTTNSSAIDNELRSPAFAIPVTGATLEYRSNFQDWNGNGDAYLDISTNGGGSWTMLTHWTSDYGPTEETVSLNNYIGQTVMLRWRYTATDSSAYYWQIDDAQVYTYNLGGEISFYNVEVSNQTNDVTMAGELAVGNQLRTVAGARLNLGSYANPTVEGSVINNGAIVQTKSVPNGMMTEFGRIQNTAANTDKYYGVRITPSSGSMGSTSVEIRGNQTCETSGDVSNGVKRCYVITPTTARTATTRLYYRSAEANSNANPDIYRQTTIWTKETTLSRGGSGDATWTAATLMNFGTLALAKNSANVNLTGGIAQTEGDALNTTYMFTATLNLAASSAFTIPYQTSDGTALAGVDYTATSGTLSFVGTANEVQTFTVEALGDTLFELDETFLVSLGTASISSVSTAGSPQTVTIIDNDAAAKIALPIIIR
ncbi:MAG: zinc-dependent metalloprotease family protein [Candidatus Promineifilaceae bacterium]